MAAGIRVVERDGTPVGWVTAFKRSAVGIGLAAGALIFGVASVAGMDPAAFAALDASQRSALVAEPSTAAAAVWDGLYQVWVWSELVVVLFNRRRRALADFIAGTVVVVGPGRLPQPVRPGAAAPRMASLGAR
jgi:uncharacterized RDD family membrane protein YckC